MNQFQRKESEAQKKNESFERFPFKYWSDLIRWKYDMRILYTLL